ncbi:DUF6020 family protein [Aerococcus urinaeequi]|uniref:DUF6020 family protein n=1 Tax=Aerococcus urinaeequi TaxID=51665 RepID=UPI0022806ED1|nr:DUF6020 family protein [Aerococcus urinaeequi]MCY7731907.1 DUF6020 family protein [Aerococcus urinaeequi]
MRKNYWLLAVIAITNLMLFALDYYGLFTAVLLFVPLYFLRDVQVEYSKRNLWILGLFAVIYIGINILSFNLNPPIRLTYYLIISFIKGLFFAGYILLYLSMKKRDWLYKEASEFSAKQNRRYAVYVALAMAFVFIPFMIAFLPGNMFIDSYSQWGQAMGGIDLTDWHPFFTTILLRISYLLTESPIIYTLGQVAGMIFAVAYFAYILASHGLKKWISSTIIAGLVLMTVMVPNMVTIYKDNIYNIALFLLTLFTFQIIQTKGTWLKGHPMSWLLYLGTLIVVMFSRHNGLYVGIAFLLLMVIFNQGTRKQMFAILVGLIALYSLYSGPLMERYNVEPGSASEKYSIIVQHMGAIIAEEKPIDATDAAFLEEILPLEIWQEKYTPSMADPVKFHSDYNKEFINDNQAEFLKTWWHLVSKYPLTALKAQLQQIQPLWDINGYEHGLPGSVMFHYFINSPKAYYDDYVENYTFDVQGLRDFLEDYSFKENPYDMETKPFITSLPAIAVFTILTVAIYLLVKRQWQFVFVLMPGILHIGTLVLAMPAYNMRYVLALIFIASFALVLPIVTKND